jgi:hypothetical protein
MKCLFTKPQLENFTKIIDIALKQSGFRNVYKFIGINNVINKQIESDDCVCEFTNTDMAVIEEIFDIALKSFGLSVAYGVIELASILVSPIPDEIEEKQ